jgi:hypothetical protein
MGEIKNAYRSLFRKAEITRHSGNLGVDGIQKQIGWEGVHYINLAQVMDQLWSVVNTVINLLVSYKCEILD